jgi:hypothetical protein
MHTTAARGGRTADGDQRWEGFFSGVSYTRAQPLTADAEALNLGQAFVIRVASENRSHDRILDSRR